MTGEAASEKEKAEAEPEEIQTPISAPVVRGPAAVTVDSPAPEQASVVDNKKEAEPDNKKEAEPEVIVEKPAPAPESAPQKAAPAKPAVPEKPPPYELDVDKCVMQGRRPKQEDRNVIVKDFTKASKALKMPIDHLDQPCSLFAVYDGHQGILCSEFIAKNFHMKLLKKLSTNTDRSFWDDQRVGTVLRECCDELDADFLAKYRTQPDGSTAVIALLTGTRLFIAWVGDSRCVLGRRDEFGVLKAVPLTVDHRPALESEEKRILDAGGVVVNFGGCLRVAHADFEEKMTAITRAQAQGLGTIAKPPVALAVSRSFGDREFKSAGKEGKALLVASPGLQVIHLERRHRFFALMCDGILDVMKDQDVVDILCEGIGNADYTVKEATSTLVQEAYKKGSEDNLTAIMVRILWPGDDSQDIVLQQPEEKKGKGRSKGRGQKVQKVEPQLNNGQTAVKAPTAKADPLFGSPPPGYVAGGGRGGIGRGAAQPKADPLFGEPPPGYVAGGGRGGIGRGAAADAAKADDQFGAPPPGYVAGRGRGAVGLRDAPGDEPDAKRPKIEIEAPDGDTGNTTAASPGAGRGRGAAKANEDAPAAPAPGGRGAGRGAGRGRGAAKPEEPPKPPEMSMV